MMINNSALLLLVLALLVASPASSFFRASHMRTRTRVASSEESAPPAVSAPAPAAAPTSKGFGKPIEKKLVVEEEPDAGTRTYTSQSKRGVPEYYVYLRPTNGTETEWVPVGSMTIPRDTPVAKAIYDVEAELLKGTFKLYPKLRAFSESRGGKQGIFEYGYVLKAFPDEPIKLLVKPDAEGEKKGFIQNWLDKLTSPVDTTDLKNPGEMTLNQNK